MDKIRYRRKADPIGLEYMEKNYRMLVINPGSTSTKISVFDRRRNIFTESVFHDAPLLLSFPSVSDQAPMRMEVISKLLEKHNIPIETIDVFIGRGGCAYSQPSGVMEIDRRLYEDTRDDKGGSDHPAKLGVMLAYELGMKYGKKMYTINPTNVDELQDVARITGIKGVYRRAQSHVLNQKGCAKLYASEIGKRYEDLSLIVCHIDGGITIAAHKNGRMIDGTEGAGGEGAFTPTRLGSVPALELARFIKEEGADKVIDMCCESAGFVSFFGTSDSNAIHKMVENGEKKATLVWNAMIYQIAKAIGEMATVLYGKVDAILLTGGLVRFDDIVKGIEDRCSWIAPIKVYPGEVEQEEMAYSILDVLEGKEECHSYTGRPVFTGFDFI